MFPDPPEKVTVADFKRYFLANFPKCDGTEHDVLIQDAIDIVYTMFVGVGTLWKWGIETEEKWRVWVDKTKACYRLLAAWYMADMHPTLVSGLPVMASGLPLREKRIDGVTVRFGETDNDGTALAMLDSNPFGVKAKAMIKTAGKRHLVRVERFC